MSHANFHQPSRTEDWYTQYANLIEKTSWLKDDQQDDKLWNAFQETRAATSYNYSLAAEKQLLDLIFKPIPSYDEYPHPGKIIDSPYNYSEELALHFGQTKWHNQNAVGEALR